MRSIIKQSVDLSASGEVLYGMYLDPAVHQAITGQPVTISAEEGSLFSAFGGALSGQTLAVIEGTLIIQSWRSTSFHADDQDSTLILSFSSHDGGGRIDLVHLDVPKHDYQGVTAGWEKYYWTPWREYLSQQVS